MNKVAVPLFLMILLPIVSLAQSGSSDELFFKNMDKMHQKNPGDAIRTLLKRDEFQVRTKQENSKFREKAAEYCVENISYLKECDSLVYNEKNLKGWIYFWNLYLRKKDVVDFDGQFLRQTIIKLIEICSPNSRICGFQILSLLLDMGAPPSLFDKLLSTLKGRKVDQNLYLVFIKELVFHGYYDLSSKWLKHLSDDKVAYNFYGSIIAYLQNGARHANSSLIDIMKAGDLAFVFYFLIGEKSSNLQTAKSKLENVQAKVKEDLSKHLVLSAIGLKKLNKNDVMELNQIQDLEVLQLYYQLLYFLRTCDRSLIDQKNLKRMRIKSAEKSPLIQSLIMLSDGAFRGGAGGKDLSLPISKRDILSLAHSTSSCFK